MRRIAISKVSAALSILIAVGVANATHFRYTHIFWNPDPGGTSNTVEFTVQSAFRRGYSSCIDPTDLTVTIPCSGAGGLPDPGDIIHETIGATKFDPGDGTGPIGSPAMPGGSLLYLVTSIDATNNWIFGVALDPASLPLVDTTISHTYAAPGDYVASIASCCRISTVSPPNAHINNPDGNYRVETKVGVGSANSSPVSVLPPIVLCPIDGLCSIVVQAADLEGDALNFRLSTADEAAGTGLSFIQPGPPDATNAASINSATGLYTWDTTGATLSTAPGVDNTLYSSQVTIEDLDTSGAVKSKSAVDFLISLVPDIGTKPVFDTPPTPVCGSTQTGLVGDALTFTVQASDADTGQTVELNVVGLPSGATQAPGLPTSGNPVSSAFSWTPQAGDDGTYVLNYSALDDTLQQALCAITLNIAAVPPTVEVEVDIRPNTVNRKSHGVIRARVLSNSIFDATSIDASTVLLAGASPLPVEKVGHDYNHDGLVDAVFHFSTPDLNLLPGATEICISGQTSGGEMFSGCDTSIRIIH